MWLNIAKFIIKNRFFILLALTIEIIAFCFLIKPKFSKSEATVLPKTDQAYINFKDFRDTFGQEDNLITIGVKDSLIFTPKVWTDWNQLAVNIEKDSGVAFVLSLGNLKVLEKEESSKSFKLKKSKLQKFQTNKQVTKFKDSLFRNYPFYEQLIFNSKSMAIRTAVYLKPKFVDTSNREEYVFELQNRIKEFEEKHHVDVKLSGLPVTRTMNAATIKSEILISILGTLLVTACIFFFFFRSFRLTIAAVLVVSTAVITTFASMYILGYDISILSGLIPPLLIVIGIPNCIFLINKYLQEYKKHQNKVKALVRMIVKVGNATLLTNLTTSFGFLTFIFTSSSSLVEFGIIASLNIIGIFIYSILIIPTVLSYMPKPKPKHLGHLDKQWIGGVIDWMVNMVLYRRKKVFITAILTLIISFIGISTLKTSGNMLDDLPKSTNFYKDISFFDQEFSGIMPLEIMIDTKRKKGVNKASTLKKINELSDFIDQDSITSNAISLSKLMKFTKQAYYNNSPEFYEIPSKQERSFILSYLKNTDSETNLLQNYVEDNAQKTRVTALIKNIETDKMKAVFDRLNNKIKEVFPQERYETYLTGGAYIFFKSTHYLIKNLLVSIGLAIVMIAIFMAIMFKTPKMILISLFPNLLPLIVTAGLMGYLGIPIKPSTILVFSIAFGISVDDTIHFLAKYRQELKATGNDIKKSVIAALRETGLSMFYTTIVLFFGFSVFLTSSFGGTKALGGLISLTLFFALLSDLILLPSLLLAFEKTLTTKRFMNSYDLFEIEDEDLDIQELKLPKK